MMIIIIITSKYAPLRWEMRQQYPLYKIAQHNIIIDVLGGVSRETLHSIIKCLTNCARCDWSVRVHYSSIKHAAYITRVLYRVIMHAAYVTSLNTRDFLSIL